MHRRRKSRASLRIAAYQRDDQHGISPEGSRLALQLSVNGRIGSNLRTLAVDYPDLLRWPGRRLKENLDCLASRSLATAG